MARRPRPNRESRIRCEIQHDQRHQLPALVFDLEAGDAQRRNAGIAHVALGQARPLNRDVVGDEAKGEGCHGEVMAAQSQRGIADQQRGDARHHHGRHHRQRRLPAVLDAENGAAVAADAGEGVLTERRLSGIAHKKIQADTEHAVDHRQLKHGQQIAAIDQRADGEQPAEDQQADLEPVEADTRRARGGLR
jgi:hypothetical protein